MRSREGVGSKEDLVEDTVSGRGEVERDDIVCCCSLVESADSEFKSWIDLFWVCMLLREERTEHATSFKLT